MNTVLRIGLTISIAAGASWTALGQDDMPPPAPPAPPAWPQVAPVAPEPPDVPAWPVLALVPPMPPEAADTLSAAGDTRAGRGRPEAG